MAGHKFRIGQRVNYRPIRGPDAASGACQVIGLLRREDGRFEYRIRNVTEELQRVAKEIELRSPNGGDDDRLQSGSESHAHKSS
jgi:hypothetical protein